ncbi:DUF3000 domain-containing protein [Tessaracoccus flavus]|uniref:Uncharacterized protein n=1 Tax=Tessaracoccus flavus TaxID=1610493 RepID=A0A1Q2CE29_9ACTN|nr:DUF3000 domain-containing protein [Tessaracoccus flavus]AQP44358.1 hypothetical protein RPIT_05630 [Tessaracoccus flavus]SDY67027.1 Protein of unknown function [Tessaracoccus flavus]
MPANVTNIAPEPFARALRELSGMRWRRHFTVDEIGSPQRIAPHSVAIEAELSLDDTEDPLATGRLILLHDPLGNESWAGTFRLVTYVRAEVEMDIVTDPLLPEVAWSWFTEALETHGCVASALAGTVTASYGKGFGEMTDADRAEVELRSSWTPTLDQDHPLTSHLAAWQDLVGQVAGQPPYPVGVAHLPTGRR